VESRGLAMHYRSIAITLFALVLSAPQIKADVTVYGQVFGESGVLEWAFVRWYGTSVCDTTCPFGNWMLLNLPADDSVKLEAWHQGYKRQTCWARPGTCDFTLEKLPDGVTEQRGDFNLDGRITASDIVGAVGQVFRGLPGSLWPEAADFNCDDRITAADLIGMVNYVFKAGPAASCGGLSRELSPHSAAPAGC
jgi:hypothetical protein